MNQQNLELVDVLQVLQPEQVLDQGTLTHQQHTHPAQGRQSLKKKVQFQALITNPRNNSKEKNKQRGMLDQKR